MQDGILRIIIVIYTGSVYVGFKATKLCESCNNVWNTLFCISYVILEVEI